MYLSSDSVLCAPYFNNKNPCYILEVVRLLKDCVFLPGDYAARYGEVGTQMYFVARGILTVLVPCPPPARKVVQDAVEVSELKKGDYFGDVALLKDCPRTAWVRSDSYSILSMLTRHDIEAVWKYFPQERDGLAVQFTARVSSSQKKVEEEERMRISESNGATNPEAFTGGITATMAVNGFGNRPKAQKDSTVIASTLGVAEPNAEDALRTQRMASTMTASAEDIIDADNFNVGQPAEPVTETEMKDCATRVEAALQAIIGKHEDLQKTMQALQKRVTDLTNSKRWQNEGVAQDLTSTVGNTSRGEDLDDSQAASPISTVVVQKPSRSSANAPPRSPRPDANPRFSANAAPRSSRSDAIPRLSANAAPRSPRTVQNVKKSVLMEVQQDSRTPATQDGVRAVAGEAVPEPIEPTRTSKKKMWKGNAKRDVPDAAISIDSIQASPSDVDVVTEDNVPLIGA